MAANSGIEWTEATLNPIAGCERISPGCVNCYAEKMAKRLAAMGQAKYQGVLDEHGRWNGRINFDENALELPLRTRKPTIYFVNSMSDWCHHRVPSSFRDKMLAVAALTPWHKYIFLTKRAGEQRDYMEDCHDGVTRAVDVDDYKFAWPLPNVILGVSAENQQYADERIPLLLETPVACRVVSAEPLLGGIDFTPFFRARKADGKGPRQYVQLDGKMQCISHIDDGDDPKLSWVIVGGESGPDARFCQIEWIRMIVAQCDLSGVSCFVKQLGKHPQYLAQGEAPGSSVIRHLQIRDQKGGNPDEWPEDLRVRQFPALLQPTGSA